MHGVELVKPVVGIELYFGVTVHEIAFVGGDVPSLLWPHPL